MESIFHSRFLFFSQILHLKLEISWNSKLRIDRLILIKSQISRQRFLFLPISVGTFSQTSHEIFLFPPKKKRIFSSTSLRGNRRKVPELWRTKGVSRSLWDTEERFTGTDLEKKEPIIIHSFCIGRVTRCNLVCSVLLHHNRDSTRCWTSRAEPSY